MMIRGLKRKLVILATIAIFLLMSVLVGIMNIINYSSVITETDMIMDLLSRPDLPFGEKPDMKADMPKRIREFVPHGMSPEVPFESRYFTAMVTETGEIVETDFSRIVSVDSESVDEYVRKAMGARHDRGFVEQFRYTRYSDNKITRIVFLDCGRKLKAFREFMCTSIIVGLGGCVLVFLVFVLGAERLMGPIAESYEKQKRFITDAGHEIKTPLTIIGANLDLLEEDVGENESLTDVKIQLERLSSLTNGLVYLSKMEEETALKKYVFPLSDMILEITRAFQPIAKLKNCEYRINIQPDITMCGDEEAIGRLMSILLDNALKYSPEKGVIELYVGISGKRLKISVLNTTLTTINEKQLTRLFDRFYRTDDSRNSETGGYGIGLSTAQAIVLAHNGKITAESESGRDLKISVQLPLNCR